MWAEVFKGVTWQERKHCIKLYIPSRTAIVLCPLEKAINLKDKPKMPLMTARQEKQLLEIQQAASTIIPKPTANAPATPEKNEPYGNKTAKPFVVTSVMSNPGQPLVVNINEKNKQVSPMVKLSMEEQKSSPERKAAPKKKIVNMIDEL